MPRIVNLRYLGTAESIIQRLASAPSDEPLDVDTLGFGAVASLWHQAEEIGLIGIIDKQVPQRASRKIIDPFTPSSLPQHGRPKKGSGE